MNISLLSGLIFIAVFAGVVFIHEFGHYFGMTEEQLKDV